MRHAACRVARGALAALALAAASARAQDGTVLHHVDSLLFAGDSGTAYDLVTAAALKAPRDGALQHKRGMIAWGMARSSRSNGFIKDQGNITLLQVADSSLRLATQLAPDSSRFWLDLGRYFLNSNLAFLRIQALGDFDHALDAARHGGDSLDVAEAADEVGMIYWRRYEAVANRYNLAQGQSVDLSIYRNDPKALRNFIENFVWQPSGFSGEGDYLKSSDLFTRALRAQPAYSGALRHALMALAERKRWEEMRRLAQVRLDAAPWDPLAWLGRGLASHRLRDEQDATVAFDSALVYLTPKDSARYTRLSRILRPGKGGETALSDSTRYASLAPAERRQMETYYWLLSDPLTLTPGNEHWLEFLARVAYSEIMWTSDDLDLKGADTDRGDIHVRYGPPDLTLGFTGSVMWVYDNGLNFVFNAPPTWGTARLSLDTREVSDDWKKSIPVSWDNIDRNIDSIAVQVARFRFDADSGDVFVVADVPMDSLMHGSDLSAAPVDIDFKIYEDNATLAVRDSTRTMVQSAHPDAVRTHAWRSRIPLGTHVYRVEALQPDAGRGARALGSVEMKNTADLAISDVVVADRVLPRGDAGAERWRDFNIVPNVGRFHRGQALSLLWETYNLATKDGANHYRVAITLERTRGSGPAEFAAKVISGVTGAVGIGAKGKGKVTLSFERNAPAKPVSVDYLSVDMGGAPTGSWTVTVAVTDVVSGKTATTSRAIRIIE